VKNLAKKIGVFDSKYYYFLQKGWFSNADFFAENGEKSVKIVIITSTPGTICILGITQVTIRAHTNVLFMYMQRNGHYAHILRTRFCLGQVGTNNNKARHSSVWL
jgi:hypothetical protein